MDQRQTFQSFEELYTMLSALCNGNENVRLLADCEGITRVEGRVLHLERSPVIGKSKAEIEGDVSLNLEQIIAVNGIFKSDYSEC